MRFCPRPDAKARALAPVLLTLLLTATPAFAQVVYCTNCSSELTQLQNYLQLVATLAKQAALLEQSITQTGLMVQNITPLAKPQYGNGQADLQALQNLIAQTNALSYASANLDAAVNARLQTYQAYAASPPTSSGLAAKYQQWSQDMEASVLTTRQTYRLPHTGRDPGVARRPGHPHAERITRSRNVASRLCRRFAGIRTFGDADGLSRASAGERGLEFSWISARREL